MQAIQKDIYIEQGTDWKDSFKIYDRDGVLADLNGASAALQIRQKCTGTLIATLTTANGGLTLVPSTNDIDAQISHVVDANFVSTEYDYDLKVMNAASIVWRAYEGNAFVPAQVTTIDPPAPSPSPSPSPDTYGNSNGDTYGNSNGDEYGPA